MTEQQLIRQPAENVQQSKLEHGKQVLRKGQNKDSIIRMEKAKQNFVFDEDYDRQQTSMLLSQLKMIEEYQKIISFEIKHQQDSISDIKPSILKRFTQLANRKQLMIQKVQQNIKFLFLLLLPYKKLFQTDKKQQKSNQRHNHGSHKHQHHQHGHKKYQSIINLFYEIAVEWGDSSLVPYISRTIQLLEKYWLINASQQYQLEGVQTKIGKRMLVVGCGTGRILSEIRNRFKGKKTNVFLQGHSPELQHHICSQYFLNNCVKQSSFFPYVHNFSNFIKQSSPYREIIIPFKLQPQSYFYPLTWGKFRNLYKNHNQQFQCLVTCYNNYHIDDIFMYIRLICKILAPGALWIDLCTSNFTNNVVQMSYQEYENILEKSQFKLLEKGSSRDYWFEDKECIMNQKRTTYYRVMQK